MISLFLSAALAAATHPRPVPAMAGSDGIIRHYVRSNRDGSEPEHIVHFRPDAAHVAVYKYMEPCQSAAYVTATLDARTSEPVRIDAGKVAKDGSQARFGAIVRDAATRRLTATVTLEGQAMADSAQLPRHPGWFLFDYDLADLSAWLQRTRPRADFRTAMALVWPESADFLTVPATVYAGRMGTVVRGGRPLVHYRLVIDGARKASGNLWLDPRTLAIVEAEASIPNHPGMTDYKLTLVREEKGGRAAWEKLLRAHWATCPKAG